MRHSVGRSRDGRGEKKDVALGRDMELSHDSLPDHCRAFLHRHGEFSVVHPYEGIGGSGHWMRATWSQSPRLD